MKRLMLLLGLLVTEFVWADELGYSPDGGLVSFGDFDCVYDSASRLMEVWSNGEMIVENRYDALGRRVIKRTPDATHTFVYDGWLLVVERIERSGGQRDQIDYWWGKDISGSLDGAGGIGGLLYIRKNGYEVYVPLYDGMGNVVQYVNSQGAIVASYAYDAFGNTTQKSGAKADELKMRFSTKYSDDEAGLYYFGRRFYSPRIARWLTRDPIEEDGGLNLYVVCDNDPVNKYDPTGCIPLDTIWDLSNVIYDICVGDKVALAADTMALMVPYVPAGATKLVKAARLSNVRKICPNVKRLEVTYRYHKYGDKHFKLRSRPQPVQANWSKEPWVQRTLNGPAQFRPGLTHVEGERLANAALREAKANGLIRPEQLDGYIYNAGCNIGAYNGKPTSFIKVKVTPQGEVHIHPITP